MLTQRANLENLVTILSGSRASEKGTSAAADSFQSFVAEGNTQWKQNISDDSVQTMPERKSKTNTGHRETYEKETISKDSYSANKIRKTEPAKQNKTNQKDMKLTDEQMEAVKQDLRDVLKQALDMTDAELDELLTAMDTDILALLDPTALQQFLMTATETEPVEFLTDSTLVDTFQQITADMEEVLQTYGLDMTDPEAWMPDTDAIPQEGLTMMPQTEKQAPDEGKDMLQESMPESVPDSQEVLHEEPKVRMDQPHDVKEEQTGEWHTEEEQTGIQVTIRDLDARGRQETGRQSEYFKQGIATDVVNQLTQAMNEIEEAPASFTSDVQQAEIIRQVIEQIRVSSGSGMDRLEVQLYPQHLGRVQIQVMMKNGVMTAQIHAETEMAKQAIESQLQRLKDSFQERSIQVEAVEVSVSTSDFQNEQERQDRAKNQQGTRSGRNRIRTDEFGMPVEEKEEQTSAEVLEAQGASVEFSA